MNTRRHFLRSTGSLIALPALESIGFKAFAAPKVVTPPKRMVFLGFGWGVTNETWFPDKAKTGAEWELSEGLKPLARHQKDITVVQGCTNKFANEAHWGSTFWLTGANRYAEPGQSFHNSISADQVAAAHLGRDTRFASLQLNTPDAQNSGHGPGLSLAWNVRGKPLAGLENPVAAFHRMFSDDTTPLTERQAMLAQKRSVLDTVMENAKAMQRGLGKNDRAKLDEYFQGIRDIETRLAKDEQWIGVPQPKAPIPQPQDGLAGKEEIKIMYDIILAAMQTDSTRVLTYRQPVSTLLTSIGIKVAPHDMSHYHSTMGEKLAASQQRDLVQSELLAGLIDKLKATKEADGSRLFDHVAIAYGSNIRTMHNLDNCPTLLTGGGAGIKLGHNIVAPKDTPLCNAWLSLLHGIGVNVERHGDSSGVLKEIVA